MYLTSQLSELGVPMVLAINFHDAMIKDRISIDEEKLSKILSYPMIKISALNGENIDKLMDIAISLKGQRIREFIHLMTILKI